MKKVIINSKARKYDARSDVTQYKAKRVREKRKKDNNSTWVLKVTLSTFIMTAMFTFLSDLTVTGGSLVVASFIVFFLISVSIIFDIVGVAVTSCDIASLLPMKSRGVKESKLAISLVKNASKVSCICSDIIGDICSIVCGACGTVIVAKLLVFTKSAHEFVLTILISSLVAGLTVGGKAYGKKFAINYSKQIVMITARILKIFTLRHKDKGYENFRKCRTKRP